jgi:hypothetical protein
MEFWLEFVARMVDGAIRLNVNVLDLNHTIVFWTPRNERSMEWWQE